MKIKCKNLLKLWILFTVFLTIICITSVFSLVKQVTFPDVSECAVEARMVGLPEVNIVEV